MAENKKTFNAAPGPGKRGFGGGPGRGDMSGARPKNTASTLRRLLAYLLRYKWLIIISVVLTFVSSASTLLGTYMLTPLVNDAILPGDFAALARGLVVLAVIYVLGALASAGQSQLMIRVAQRSIHKIRADLFKRLQRLPIRYFDQHSHGELMSLFTNDIDAVQMSLEQSILQLLSSIVSFVGTIVMMIILSPWLTLSTVVILVVMVLVAGAITKRSRKYFIEQQAAIGAVNGYIEEMIEGQKVIKVFNHEDTARADFAKLNETYRSAATNAHTFAGVIMPVLNNLNNINYAVTAALGGLLTIFNMFSIGALASFLQYSRNFSQPIQQVTNQMNNILAALAGAERIFDAMDQEPEVDEGEIRLIPVEKNADGSIAPLVTDERGYTSVTPNHWAWKKPDGELVELTGDMRFHNVDFGYDADKAVLKDVSLYAKPGQKIAFVGSTGAGKTTITNLINRFYDVQEGQITYDGLDIQSIRKDDLRHSLGMVLQDTNLFSGTIADNIRFGRLDATDDEVIGAARLASADTFIRHLPQGYDTWISGNGENLSQGQRQLLAIARAAIANPPVLILDEATSSIDTRTERLIDSGMDALMSDRTVFVIAHRLSTVRNSNAIMVIENGEIIERGDHEDLIAQKGRYYQLYTGQFELS